MTVNAATFKSVLYPEGTVEEPEEAPGFFRDLNLDQVVENLVAGREEYNLAPFFSQPLRSVGEIRFRQEVFRDLEKPPVAEAVKEFAAQMQTVRSCLQMAQKVYHPLQKQAWFLEAVVAYCDAVAQFSACLKDLSGPAPRGAPGSLGAPAPRKYQALLEAEGLLALQSYLEHYVGSGEFIALHKESKKLKADLAALKYTIHISGNKVTVGRYEGEKDYSAVVLATFEKFRLGTPKDYLVKFALLPDVNSVEGRILDLVARLNADLFAALHEHYVKHQDFLDAVLVRFDREVQFYLAFLELVERCRAAGLEFCYPAILQESKEVAAWETFDIALAIKFIAEHRPVVTNDFFLQGQERIIVVTGPNQGGKTTFARAFGQIHYLASLGCPVPGREARLFLWDRLLTHFEREEQIETLRGKLEDDLVRMQEILSTATASSLIILNEIFTATTVADALFLSRKVMEQLVSLDVICVWVTFIDELAFSGPTVVSMMSTVDPHDPTVRTYKVVRKPADGRAFALAIAEKYGLTYEALKSRLEDGGSR